MSIPAYPLQWPEGWRRIPPSWRERARFGKASRGRAGDAAMFQRGQDAFCAYKREADRG